MKVIHSSGQTTECVRFEVSTAVTMMIIIFWEMTPCGSYKNRPWNIPGNEPRPKLPGYSSQHHNIWYPFTRLVFPPTLPFPYDCIPHTILYSKYRYSKLTPHSSNLGLFTRSPLGVVFYESLPIRELTTSLCACSHSCTLKMEAIRSSETSVLIRATRRHLPEDYNHQTTEWFIEARTHEFHGHLTEDRAIWRTARAVKREPSLLLGERIVSTGTRPLHSLNSSPLDFLYGATLRTIPTAVSHVIWMKWKVTYLA
jgi:hypothetical protein